MDASLLESLNDQQRAAATAPDGPLLIIAGAGTGKTNTLAHRVAHLISRGVNPGRILLLTFTRRASAMMLRRVESILSSADQLKVAPSALALRIWGGTFHATANRLLRVYGQSLGLGENFTVVDRSDAEDLLNEVRGEIGLDAGEVRFPRKGTCLSIYSRCVNAQEPVEQALKTHFPWRAGYPDQLKKLFRAYTQRKQEQNLLDYDDLLLYWFHLMQDDSLAAEIQQRFDAVLLDEYQDTNALQAGILKKMCPDGKGLTVVGDDAQSIYSFRAATVHNILDFPKVWPGTTVLKLEQNYRSVQPILDATNSAIALCPNRYNKDLFSDRKAGQKPRLVTLVDEDQQSDYVIRRCLEHLEAGVALQKQAVLFRASHHSDALEVELARRNIPFVKYGGLKFLEAAHVKDVLAILRLAENPRDSTSAFRVLQLLDGVGPAHARRAIAHLADGQFNLRAWQTFAPPAPAAQQWGEFVEMLLKVAPNHLPLPEQVAAVREFYSPILEKRYDQSQVRQRDLEQLEQICTNFRSRNVMLTELALDPPSATQDLAGPPLREEDFLILSTIHSAKGCEWDAVYVIHAADGNIPSDMATGSEEEIEEERRLFYVAMTRARDFLEVCVPLRYYHKKHATGDRHTYAQPTRFLPESIVHHFERVSMGPKRAHDAPSLQVMATDVRKKIAAMWA
ncbi:MAG TPA: ATP-dependent helicase [Tepidisphaeraceae bacterium]|jgi:DNA helicase-2/ATP-dependent DNA helicase PcrA|nr:ATP-dependent helicase [Tepidisphaeraceae bacterium]